MTYWDAVNGYNPNMQESKAADGAPTASAGGPIEGGTAYLSVQPGIGGEETHEIDLMDDGTCKFFLPGSTMITDVYAGTYTVAEDGVTVTITGLTNVDSTSQYTIPGLWSYIDSATGDTVITIDAGAFTYSVPGGKSAGGPAPEVGAAEGAYTCEMDGMMGKETLQFVLNGDGTCEFSLPGNPVITDVYAGAYTREGNTVTIMGLTNVDASSEHKTPGLWDWIVDGNTTITVEDSTFTPAQ